MQKKLGVGIFGTGWVSGEHIKAYLKNGNTEVLGLYDINKDAANQKKKENNLDCQIYDSLDEMLKNKDIDIISVCAIPSTYKEAVTACARAGKHMVVEKPVGLSWEETKTIRDEVKKAGVKTVVSFVLRWNPLIEIAKNLVNDGTLGKLTYVQCDYIHHFTPEYKLLSWARTKKVGVSSFVFAGCHALDFVRYVAESEVEEVFAMSNGNRVEQGYEYDPNITAVIKFKNGIIAKSSSLFDCVTPYIFNLDVMGDKGTLRNNRLFAKKFLGQTDYATIPTILPDNGDVTHHPFSNEINHFIECIQTGKESHCNIADAAKTMELCFAIDKSAETGKIVKLPLE